MHETCDGISIWGWNKIENIKFAKIKVQRVYMYRLYRNSLSKEHITLTELELCIEGITWLWPWWLLLCMKELSSVYLSFI
jgi:hypothetical protein